MKVTISYKHLESTPAIDEITHRKSEKLKKYFDGKINLKWNFTVEKKQHIAHCHLTSVDNIDFFAEAQTDSIYSAIDEVESKLEKQIRKKKEMVKTHKAI